MTACNDSMGIEAQEEHVSEQGWGGVREGRGWGGSWSSLTASAGETLLGETVLGENGVS